MRFIKILFVILFVLLFRAFSFGKANEHHFALPAIDKVYYEQVKTVQLYPLMGSKDDPLFPAALPLSQEYPLWLMFDELGTETRNLYAKIIHCNRNWDESNLASMQYMDDINEVFINDREASFATRANYVHYQLTIPKVKISGNFLLVIYEDNDFSRVVLTRRFIVYEQVINILPAITYPADISTRNFFQQVNFTVDYGNLNLINPQDNLHIKIRQNHRWDKTIENLPPLYVRESERILDYNYFNNENIFHGGNEFRYFDNRSLRFGGVNVDKVLYDNVTTEVLLIPDDSRNRRAYGYIRDIDGKYVIENYESGDSETNPDYVFVSFFLRADIPYQEDVYVFGALSDWEIKESHRMIYDPERKRYVARILMKQGYFNYEYVTARGGLKNEVALEGTHQVTQNYYDIIAYYRAPGTWNDVIIGYINIRYPNP